MYDYTEFTIYLVLVPSKEVTSSKPQQLTGNTKGELWRCGEAKKMLRSSAKGTTQWFDE